MNKKAAETREKYKERYDLTDAQADDLIIFEHNNKLLVGMAFCDRMLQDQNFYLFDADTITELNNMPIAQIKFLENQKPIMFIRRLEFVDNSFKGKGYATALLKSFEEYCRQNGYTCITGEFVPLHNEDERKVAKFYDKNGYHFCCDEQGQPHIIKKLEQQKTNAEDMDM